VEPIYIGGQAVFCKFFALARLPGDPSRIEGTFTLVGGEGTLTLDALVGPQGIPGEPSPAIRPQFGSPITDPEDLPDPATLDDSDNGRAWYIDGQWHVWYEGDYHVIEGSIPGPPGAVPDISVTAEQTEPIDAVPVYGPITVTESGTSLAPNFHIEIPGIAGPEGPAASIGSASDFDNDGFEVCKFIACVTEDPDTYGLVSPATIYQPAKIWTIPEGNFLDHSGAEGRFLIASLDIPAQDFDYYPDVTGHVRLRRSILSTAQIEVEVRIGDTGSSTGETEPLCGLAPYDPAWALLDSISIAHILPHFSDTGDPLRSISPDTDVARVLSGQAKTFYVFIHKTGGAGGYIYTKATSQVRVAVMPTGPAEF
jgi:hypothetical protein